MDNLPKQNIDTGKSPGYYSLLEKLYRSKGVRPLTKAMTKASIEMKPRKPKIKTY